jgi:hypothetical protein
VLVAQLDVVELADNFVSYTNTGRLRSEYSKKKHHFPESSL